MQLRIAATVQRVRCSMGRLRNQKHETFAREIAAMTPYERAYQLAGFRGDPRWHRFNASKLKHKPDVQARIEELSKEFDQRAGIHAEYIKRQLLPIVEANVQDLYERDSAGQTKLKAISDIPRNVAAAISKIKFDPETGLITEVALASKTEAGSLLLRSVGGLVDRKELTGAGGGPFSFATVVDESMALVMQRREAREAINAKGAKEAESNAPEPSE
jgi:hypothetical protein